MNDRINGQMTSPMKRILVLISGSGSDLQAILDGCAGGKIAGQVVGVISNKADAYGLVRARGSRGGNRHPGPAAVRQPGGV